ncbi:hypothetical protein Tco_0491578 [Tanacetum coccineum]
MAATSLLTWQPRQQQRVSKGRPTLRCGKTDMASYVTATCQHVAPRVAADDGRDLIEPQGRGRTLNLDRVDDSGGVPRTNSSKGKLS